MLRVPPANRNATASNGDQMDPMYVGDFPQQVRDAQAEYLHNYATGLVFFLFYYFFYLIVIG